MFFLKNMFIIIGHGSNKLRPVMTHENDLFFQEIKGFNSASGATRYENENGIPYCINEFWTAKQRQSHSLHEISYRACFKAELPEFFISRLTKPGDTVLDPFMGRGTTLIQAALSGRSTIGNDINPLSVLLARPRLSPISIDQVESTLSKINWGSGEIEHEELLVFYHPSTLRKIDALKKWLEQNVPLLDDDVDPVGDWIRMVALNRLSGHSSGFFSGRSMPPNQAVSIVAQTKINKKLGISPPERDVSQIILKKTKSLLRDGTISDPIRYAFHVGAAWDMKSVRNSSINLTVTSPPFLDIVQYATDNWLRCWFAGINVHSIPISSHRTEKSWMEMVHDVVAELFRVTRPGGYVAFEVGEVRNGTVFLEKSVWQAVENTGFERIFVMINDQNFTKTANCWGVNNGNGGTNTNRIVILKK